MADLAKLKAKTAGRGIPPAPDATNTNLRTPPREKPAQKGKIEFSVPEPLLDEFAQEAGRRFGFKKGSKSHLFLAIWEEYKTSRTS